MTAPLITSAVERQRKRAVHPKAHIAPTSDVPRAGYYLVRLVRGGPWCPARIYFGQPHDPVTGEILDRSYRMVAEVNGEPHDVYRIWPYCAGDEIDKAEYDYRIADRDWCVQFDSTAPQANSRSPINIDDLPVPEF